LGAKVKTFDFAGEFRAPKKGEYFLSGASVTAYLAKNDLTQEYFIAKPHVPKTCPCCGKTE